MKKTVTEIPVFFTVDDSYVPYLGVAISSMKKNASPEYKYKIIVLQQELNDTNKQKISDLADEKFEIRFEKMKDMSEEITDRAENRLRCDYFTMTIYYRLFIADMFPEYDKAIYIDSDVVIPGDISELFNYELGDNIIGACVDHSIEGSEELMEYTVQAVGIPRGMYINSGVLLLNLKKMRQKKFTGRFMNLLNTYHFDCLAPDQDYFNAMCHGKILYLDECWDAMPDDGKEPIKEPKLIHYNLFSKPWCYDNIQYEEYFWEYAKETSFYDKIVEHKENYSDEQKKDDSEHMRLMVQKGTVVINNEITFEKIRKSGVEIRI